MSLFGKVLHFHCGKQRSVCISETALMSLANGDSAAASFVKHELTSSDVKLIKRAKIYSLDHNARTGHKENKNLSESQGNYN
jgi:hypothetical protein